VELQFILLTLLKQDIESCKQVIISLRMRKKVILLHFDTALDVIHHDDEHGLQMLRSLPCFMQNTRRCVCSIRRDERLTVLRVFVQRYLPIAL
jgi:hypothetical protein